MSDSAAAIAAAAAVVAAATVVIAAAVAAAAAIIAAAAAVIAAAEENDDQDDEPEIIVAVTSVAEHNASLSPRLKTMASLPPCGGRKGFLPMSDAAPWALCSCHPMSPGRFVLLYPPQPFTKGVYHARRT